MKDQLIQVLKDAGYRIVKREALTPNVLAVDQIGLEYEPVAFNRVRKVHSFYVWLRAHTPEEVITKADEIMTVLWSNLEEVSSISAEFEDEIARISVNIPEG